jgi:hypothetical protein
VSGHKEATVSAAKQEARHLVAARAARAMAKQASDAASTWPVGSAEWRFYHGVETAAQHVLHPQMGSVREGTAWLDAEGAAFRAGFLEGAALLATAVTSDGSPLHVRLPVPRRINDEG